MPRPEATAPIKIFQQQREEVPTPTRLNRGVPRLTDSAYSSNSHSRAEGHRAREKEEIPHPTSLRVRVSQDRSCHGKIGHAQFQVTSWYEEDEVDHQRHADQ